MCSFQERNFSSLSIRGNTITLQTAHRNFLILFQIFLHPNINFVISKQKNTPKIDPIMLKQQAGIAILKHVLSFTQTNRALWSNKQMNTSTAMNCIYSLPCSCSDFNDMLNKFSCLVHTWFQYLYINSKDIKFHLNSH